MRMVLDHWPQASIRDVGRPTPPEWEKPAGQLGDKAITLDALEHRVLRPMGEPRIHFAIVCASASCPDLRTEPYTAVSSMRNSQRKLGQPKRLKVEEGRIRVSQIFDWFKKDFDKAGGVEVNAGNIGRNRTERRNMQTKARFE